jgi:hypothetical protein
MHNRSLVLAAAAVAVAMLAPGRAHAHDLRATVKVLPDAVVVEAGFDDDTPAEGAKVVVTDTFGKEVATGRTNEKGVWRVPRPGAGTYKVVVESAGHRDEVEFVIELHPLDAPIEYVRERPNQTIGLAIGVGGLLAASAAFWWLRRKKAT